MSSQVAILSNPETPHHLDGMFTDLDASFSGDLEFTQAATRDNEDLIQRDKVENGKGNTEN